MRKENITTELLMDLHDDEFKNLRVVEKYSSRSYIPKDIETNSLITGGVRILFSDDNKETKCIDVDDTLHPILEVEGTIDSSEAFSFYLNS